MLTWVGQFLMKELQAFLSWAGFLLAFLTFGPLDLITSFHIFLSYALKKLPLNLEFYVKTKHSVLLFPHAIQF